ncbi:hypothetical protein [Streptomyces atratus]
MTTMAPRLRLWARAKGRCLAEPPNAAALKVWRGELLRRRGERRL